MDFPLALPVRCREQGKRNWERCLGVACDPLGVAANSRSRSASPPTRRKRAAVLATVKVRPAKSEFAARLARRPTLTAPARGGELSARSGRRNGFRIEQRNGPKAILVPAFRVHD